MRPHLNLIFSSLMIFLANLVPHFSMAASETNKTHATEQSNRPSQSNGNTCPFFSDKGMTYSQLMNDIKDAFAQKQTLCLSGRTLSTATDAQDFMKDIVKRPVSTKELVDYEITKVIQGRIEADAALRAANPEFGMRSPFNLCNMDPRMSHCSEKLRGEFYAEVFSNLAKQQVSGEHLKKFRNLSGIGISDVHRCLIDPEFGFCKTEVRTQYRSEVMRKKLSLERSYFFQEENSPSTSEEGAGQR